MSPLALLPLLAAGGGAPPIVASIAVAFIAAAAFALVCERVRLPSIAGFIFAGLLVGPVGLGFIHDPEEIETIAELGLVLLLFLIGLELDLRALLESGRTLILTGLLQVPVSVGVAIAVFLGAAALGLGSGGIYPALYLALGRIAPSAVVELNRAVAVAMASGPERGLRIVEGVAATGQLEEYPYLHAARADLLRRLGRLDEAGAAYTRARELTANEAEQAFLDRRIAEVSGG